MASTTTIEIPQLPMEILVDIFSYLDQTDRHFGVARVCKFWLELVRFHLTDKVVLCHELIRKPNHPEYSRYSNISGPKVYIIICWLRNSLGLKYFGFFTRAGRVCTFVQRNAGLSFALLFLFLLRRICSEFCIFDQFHHAFSCSAYCAIACM
jgi:hypothetical protein